VFVAAYKANNLEALLFPGPSSAGIASKPGYPTVLVPFGMIPNPATPFGAGGRGGRGGDGRGGDTAAAPPPMPLPPGFDPKPQPFGVGFTGGACSEPKLLELAYSFEQATKKRTPPPGLR
jgi:amidase